MRIALLSLIAAVSAAPALAADLGTYRPGTPYHSTQVPAADVCASTCAGDAQCRGWNYVKPNPQASGVCELQSQVGAPVSSAISISGLNSGAAPQRANVVSGNTNTVRVGTSAAPAPRAQQQTAPSGHRIVHQPVPQAQAARRTAQPTSYARPQQPRRVPPQAQPRINPNASLTEQQNAYRRAQPDTRVPQPAATSRAMAAPQAPRFQPMLDGRAASVRALQRPQMMPQNPQGYAPQAAQRANLPVQSRGPARSRSRSAQPRQQAAQQAAMAPAPRPMPAASQGRPPIGQPILPSAASMPSRSAAEPVTFEQAQSSLYGSLHDDVRVPAANLPMPADPNAAIPTSQSRPVAPVVQQQLAGARSR